MLRKIRRPCARGRSSCTARGHARCGSEKHAKRCPHAATSQVSCLHHDCCGGWRRKRATAALLWAQKLKHPQRILHAVAIAALLPVFAAIAAFPTRQARVVIVTGGHTSYAVPLDLASLAASQLYIALGGARWVEQNWGIRTCRRSRSRTTVVAVALRAATKLESSSSRPPFPAESDRAPAEAHPQRRSGEHHTWLHVP